ncbi:MAG: hypothetical protein Kow00109_11100 [Acidobacteriota bacterium]
MNKGEGARGFTLLEVIVSFTILALVSGIVFVGLRFALNAYDRAQQRIERSAVQRALFGRLKHQVASLYPVTPMGGFLEEAGMPDPVQDPLRRAMATRRPLFVGAEDFMVFVSVVSLLNTARPGLTVVRYGLAQDEQGNYYLGVMETPYTGEGSFAAMVEAPRGTPYPLVEGIRSVAFQYYGFDPASRGYAWFTAWSGPDVGAAPEAVQIHFDDRYVLLQVQCPVPGSLTRMPPSPLVGTGSVR